MDKLLITASVIALGVSVSSNIASAHNVTTPVPNTVVCLDFRGNPLPNNDICDGIPAMAATKPDIEITDCPQAHSHVTGSNSSGEGHGSTDTDGDGVTDQSGSTPGTNGQGTNSHQDVGASVGGNSGGGGGCFIAGTLVDMADGNKKSIEDIKLGDVVKDGGRVNAVGSFYAYEIYDYKGVKVSGSHAVLENNVWMRVRDSKKAKLISEEETIVYVHANEHSRIIIEDIIFADYNEVDLSGTELYEIYDDQMITLLNQQLSDNKVLQYG